MMYTGYPNLGLDLDLNLNFLPKSQDADPGEVLLWQSSYKEKIRKCGHKSVMKSKESI